MSKRSRKISFIAGLACGVLLLIIHYSISTNVKRTPTNGKRIIITHHLHSGENISSTSHNSYPYNRFDIPFEGENSPIGVSKNTIFCILYHSGKKCTLLILEPKLRTAY